MLPTGRGSKEGLPRVVRQGTERQQGTGQSLERLGAFWLLTWPPPSTYCVTLDNLLDPSVPVFLPERRANHIT